MTKPASTPTLTVISTLPVIVACALLGLTDARAATTGYVVAIDQAPGPNVIAAGIGEIDLTVLEPAESPGFADGSYVQPNGNAVAINTGPRGLTNTLDAYFFGTTFAGPKAFGPSSNETDASSGEGDSVELSLSNAPEGGGLPFLLVPRGYVSDAPLMDTAIYNNQTLASLGITPGTYTWTWGNGGPNQSFTIDAIAPSVAPPPETPVPAALPLFATGIGGLGLLGWRRKRKAQRASLLEVAQRSPVSLRVALHDADAAADHEAAGGLFGDRGGECGAGQFEKQSGRPKMLRHAS